MAIGRLKPDRAAGHTVPVTGSNLGQAAIISSIPIPNVGEGDDGGAIESRPDATQPPLSSKLHALERLTNGVRRARTRSPELERGFTVQGSKNNVSRAPRVGHKKSRKGCAQCKRRHVKCNEEAPCSNCVRHSVACSLAGGPNVPRDDAKPKQRSPATSISSHSTRNSSLDTSGTHSTATAIASSTASTSLGASPADLNEYNPIQILTGNIDRNAALTNQAWMLDLELMHHFTAFNSDIMTEHFDIMETMWQHEMPRIAFDSQYVMHGLLGFSALHLATLRPERALALRASATNHLDQALVFYRQDNGPATAENSNARFTFTWLVAMFAFAIPSSVPPIDAMVELFSLVRGIEIVLQESLLWIIQGPFAPILTRAFVENRGMADDGSALSMAFAFQASTSHAGGNDCVPGDELPEGMDFGLNHLDFMIGMHSMIPEERRTCVLVLTELKQLYAQMLSSQASCGMSMVMCFPRQDPSHFSLLLKRRHPQALVILAYYTVLLDLLDTRWWVHGWGRRVLRDVVACLGDEWKSWIEWPIQTVLMKPIHQPSLSPSISMDTSMLG